MALNSSGPISLIGTITGQSIQKELGGTGASQLGLLDSSIRTLSGISSGPVGLFNLYGKANDIVTWASPSAGSTIGTVIRGNAYSTTTLSASSTAGAITYSVVSGSLPSGLSLSSNTISGTVDLGATVATYSFTIRATGPQGATSDRVFNIVVNNISGTVCGSCTEGSSVTLNAPSGTTFKYLVFANYGTPSGCPSPSAGGDCGAGVSFEGTNINGSTSITFSADNGIWGDPCYGIYKSMTVVAYYG